MKKIFFLALAFLWTSMTHGQLTKKTWLVGGSGSFKSFNNSFSSTAYNTESKIIELKLTPNIGYFIIDNLAIGLKSSLNLRNEENTRNDIYGKSLRLDYGPFIRYYFLDKEKRLNILADLAYQLGNITLSGEKGARSNFSFLTGPVIYFNSSVGVEFLVGYLHTTEQISSSGSPSSYSFKDTDKGFHFEIALQIHLEKL